MLRILLNRVKMKSEKISSEDTGWLQTRTEHYWAKFLTSECWKRSIAASEKSPPQLCWFSRFWPCLAWGFLASHEVSQLWWQGHFKISFVQSSNKTPLEHSLNDNWSQYCTPPPPPPTPPNTHTTFQYFFSGEHYAKGSGRFHPVLFYWRTHDLQSSFAGDINLICGTTEELQILTRVMLHFLNGIECW